MLFNPINLESELIRERSRQHKLTDTVYAFLEEAESRDRDVIRRIKGHSSSADKEICLSEEDTQKIFTLDTIRTICITYRLRFLESRYFKADLPYEAISRVHAFERRYGFSIEKFHVVAPDTAFDLQNINKDPMLFAELPNGGYYLVHKWGNDLEWHKRLTAWPVQSFRNYMITLTLAGFLLAFLIPSSIMNVFNFSSEIYLRLWLAIHTLIGLMGMTLWYGLTFNKTFSNLNWNSKYYNY